MTDSYINDAITAIKLLENQIASIDQAVELIISAIQEDRLVHIFGVDSRSADIEGEVFFRAGGLTCINPIYDPSLANSHGAYRSEMCRTLDGLTPRILDYYESIEEGDPIILLSFDPESISFRQAVEWSIQHNLCVISITPKIITDTGLNDLMHSTITFDSHVETATLCMTVILNIISQKVAKHVSPNNVWKGAFFPDLILERPVIDSYLWRVRHL